MAALKYADRVAESTISTGLSDISLAGAIDLDHASFASQFADGDEMPVIVFGGGKWMSFVGRYNSGPNSLTRVTFRSSSTGSNLSLSGTMTVLCGWGAADAAAMLRTDMQQSLNAAQQKQALSNLSAWDPGDAKLTFRATAGQGWFFCDDGSIGNVASNATTRANADTIDCFTALYAITALVVQDSTGAAVGRGASAAADYAANRRLVIPKTLGRAIAIAGSGSGLTARALGATAGSETETPTIAKTATHDHLGTSIIGNSLGPTVSNIGPGSGWSINGSANTSSTGGGTPLNIVQPEFFVNIAIKL